MRSYGAGLAVCRARLAERWRRARATVSQSEHYSNPHRTSPRRTYMLKTLRARLDRSDEGFTLIELLIVIVILGVLAGIVVFAVGGINDTSKVSACKSDVKTVETAAEAYYAGTSPHTYAADINALVTAKILREAPSTTNGYTVTYNSTTGVVSATGLTGCP